MEALFTLAVSGVNVFPTILLGFVILYWLVMIVTAIDIDGFDLEIDMDEGGLGAELFTFLKIGDVPFSIYMSLLILTFWFFNMSVSIVMNSWGGFWNLTMLLPSLVAAALVTRVVTIPLKILLKGVNGKGNETVEIIGATGTLKFALKENALSQVVIEKSDMLVNCRSKNGVSLPAGAAVTIVQKDSKENFYIIEPTRELE